jgi:hypothetical protein
LFTIWTGILVRPLAWRGWRECGIHWPSETGLPLRYSHMSIGALLAVADRAWAGSLNRDLFHQARQLMD